jgi:type IV pilus assembly protein PilB
MLSNAYSATEYLEQLFEFAFNQSISDIHFEPFETHLQVRLRQDGLLSTYPSPLPSLTNAISTRLKILATLDIGEKRLPQDGEFSYTKNSNLYFHLRVSTCPTLYGEKIVLRLFHSDNTLSPTKLGLEQTQYQHLIQAISQPQGLILVTGPTGSGKSTTLYSLLQHLNNGSLNIMTAEDPIEIKLQGISQTAIKPQIGFTFSTALRTFLRQDPDIIMVGEIRDQETAAIALHAAQTGHLVLTTLHTNDSLQTLSRLFALNIDMSALADSLSLIVSQRLVRKCCDDGYRGRIGIFEVLPISSALRDLIRQRAAMPLLEKQAIIEGWTSLAMEAQRKVSAGVTSREEVLRIVGKF